MLSQIQTKYKAALKKLSAKSQQIVRINLATLPKKTKSVDLSKIAYQAGDQD